MSESLRVRCVICGEILSYTPDNTALLLQHLRSKHPCLSIACLKSDTSCSRRSKSSHSCTGGSKTETSMENKGDQCCKDQDAHMNPSKQDNSMPSETGYEKCSKHNMEESPKGHRTVYNTTVEAWSTATISIVCAKCGHHGQPIQRRSRKKSSYSSLGAFCLLGCWPSCFLPFLTCSEGDVVNLYCAECNAFLGVLDNKSKVANKSKNTQMEAHSAPNLNS